MTFISSVGLRISACDHPAQPWLNVVFPHRKNTSCFCTEPTAKVLVKHQYNLHLLLKSHRFMANVIERIQLKYVI